MRGIVYDGAKAFVSDALALRAPEAGEVIVRIRAAGLCHSDLSVLDGTIEWPVPVVLGHEGAGVVEEVGAGVRGLAPGDPVVLHTLAACGRCRHCAAGRPTWCRSTFGNRATPFTLAGRPCHDFAATSVFVERTVVGAGQAVKIPHDVPFASAALVGCGVITGVGAVLNRARVRAGETAAVRVTYDHLVPNADADLDGERDPGAAILVIQSSAAGTPTRVVPVCGRIVPEGEEMDIIAHECVHHWLNMHTGDLDSKHESGLFLACGGSIMLDGETE